VALDRDAEQARARILRAAMAHFALRGFTASTLRDIASQAGVSLGLIRHHFGSKQDLREACTNFTLNAVRSAEAQATRRGPDMVEVPAELQRYIARTVLEDSPGGRALFDEMFAASIRLNRVDDSVESSVLPLVLTVMTLGIPLLEAQLTRILGTPALEGEGLTTVQRALVELFTTTQMDTCRPETT
jgi:AcrR family transcriptional regulator